MDHYPSNQSEEQSPTDLSYEQAISELEKIVATLETDNLALETSLLLFERGQALSRRCTDLLDQAELRVRQLVGDSLTDFDE